MTATFYTQQAGRARALLGVRFGQGGIVLVQRTTTPGENEWDDPIVTTTRTTLKAVQRGVETELVGQRATTGGPLILAGAKHVTAVPPDVAWTVTDAIEIDGKSYSILKAEPVGDPAAPAFVKFLVQA